MNGTKVDAGLGCMSFLFPAMWVVQEWRKYHPLIAAASMLLFQDMWAVQQGRKELKRQEDHLLNLFCCPGEQLVEYRLYVIPTGRAGRVEGQQVLNYSSVKRTKLYNLYQVRPGTWSPECLYLEPWQRVGGK